jgi:hypothetical protein
LFSFFTNLSISIFFLLLSPSEPLFLCLLFTLHFSRFISYLLHNFFTFPTQKLILSLCLTKIRKIPKKETNCILI